MAWLEFYRGIVAVKKEGLRLMIFKRLLQLLKYRNYSGYILQTRPDKLH